MIPSEIATHPQPGILVWGYFGWDVEFKRMYNGEMEIQRTIEDCDTRQTIHDTSNYIMIDNFTDLLSHP